ncbi:hypothetical protein GCM10023080_022850 [Streptomyces pseudoechinosporeus]
MSLGCQAARAWAWCDPGRFTEQSVQPTAAGDQPVQVVAAIMVPHWQEGLPVDALPDAEAGLK